jgi:hypothetical protein
LLDAGLRITKKRLAGEIHMLQHRPPRNAVQAVGKMVSGANGARLPSPVAVASVAAVPAK